MKRLMLILVAGAAVAVFIFASADRQADQLRVIELKDEVAQAVDARRLERLREDEGVSLPPRSNHVRAINQITPAPQRQQVAAPRSTPDPAAVRAEIERRYGTR